MSPRKHLEKRLIHIMADKAGWLENDVKHRWQYPVLDRNGKIIATRSKAYPEYADEMKYGWVPNKPANPDAQWYVLPGAIEATKARGIAYLANGEPASLAYHAAGIHNVIATTLSEIAVPTDTVSYLRAIGVSRLLYPVDKDEAGLKSAINWRDALAGSGIDFEAFQWPENMPAKADANDVLIHVNGDKEAFRLVINSLQAIELPAQVVDEKKYSIPAEFDKGGLVSAVRMELDKGGHLGRKIRQRVWLECHCPFHTDKKKSAGFNIESGVINCFGGCGKAFSPIAVAEHFNVDWKQFLPERESKPKPRKVKAEKQPESNSSLHETTEAEKEAELEAAFGIHLPEDEMAKIREKIAIRNSAYDAPAFPAGNHFIGWFNQDETPASFVKCLLHLADSNSMIPSHTIRFHRAVRAGRINPKRFTVTDVVNALDAWRDSIDDFIDTGLKWHLFMELDTQYLEEEPIGTSPTKKSKGRPATLYAVNEDTEGLINYLIDYFYRPCLLERLCPKEIAPIMESVQEDLAWPYIEWLDWLRNHESPRERQTARMIDEKLVDLLENRAHYEFTEADLEKPSKLRGKIAKLALAPYSERIIKNEDGTETIIPAKGIQLSRAKLALELGNSESSLTKLFADNGIGAKRVKGWVEVPNANGADIETELREAPNRLNSNLGGVSIGLSLKVWDAGKERRIKLSYGTLARSNFRKWDGRIIRMDILVEQPSLLWNMTAKEIKEKQAKAAEIEAQAADTGEASESAQIQPKEAPEAKPKAPRKPVFSRGKNRTWKGHSPEWLQLQLALRVHRHTASYRLENLTILSEKREVIATLENQAAVMSWVKQHGIKEGVRTVESFFQPEKFTPAQAPAPKAEIAPAKTVTSVTRKPAPKQIESDWVWAEHEEEFAARMAAIGGRP